MPSLLDLDEIAGVAIRQIEASSSEGPAPDGKWRASGLAGCPRKQVLARAGFPEDSRAVLDALATRMGTVMHSEFENWLQVYAANPKNDMQIICQEERLFHVELNLTAKPDALVKVGDRYLLIDLKTERGGCTRCNFGSARHWREESQKKENLYTSAKYDHRIQLTATAMVLQSNGYQVDEAEVWYFTKDSWFSDQQPVNVNDPWHREMVELLCKNLDLAWENYQEDKEVLPPRLTEKDQLWQCTPQKDSNLGRWCPVRSICMNPLMPE